uniref:MAM domain-containing protein n=1 Tax=Strongyloides papillosus TaxID=174720 RepID=A0A0N5C5S5_STREA
MENSKFIIYLLVLLIDNHNCRFFRCIFVIKKILVPQLNAQIQHSFDLNCDFDKNNLCLWHNSNVTWDHTSDWTISESILNITSIKKEIAPMPLNNGFIYTNGTNHGLNSALLVSDVISCQLGGAEIKYWYYKTQINSRLEICVRQPPGSLNILQQKCYDGVQAVQANQWVHQKIELPPSSQPFEILIRAYFIHPDDIIAIDKISYEAALCGSTHGQISVITIDKWNEVKDEMINKEENVKPMLVIADSINQKDDILLDDKSNDNNNTVINQKSIDIDGNVTKINEDALPKFLNVIHDVSPLLTMLWKSLQPQHSSLYTNQLLSIPSTSSLINSNIPIVAKASKTSSIDESININDEGNLNNNDNLLKSPMKYEVPINKNIYTAKINQNNIRKKTYKQLPTKVIYPSNFHPHQIKVKLTTPIIPINYSLSNENYDSNANNNVNESNLSSNYKLKKKTIIQPKTTYEEGIIEKMDRIPGTELSKPNYISVQQPNNTEYVDSENDIPKSSNKINFIFNKLSEQSVNIDDITRQLTPEMINELQMLSNFDDLESLTEGMDLSLLTKPGGFNILRQQFLERLIQKKLDKDISKP